MQGGDGSVICNHRKRRRQMREGKKRETGKKLPGIQGRKLILRAAAILIAGILTAEGGFQAAGAIEIPEVQRKTAGEREIRAGSDGTATPSDAQRPAEHATPSNALMLPMAAGDFWQGRSGDLSFLDGSRGDGTEEEPYQISTRAQLMGLAELAAGNMTVQEGDGKYPGDYHGAHFMLTKDIDLGGMEWIPIGFYKDQASMDAGILSPFQGTFDGNGKTVSNFRLYRPSWDHTGLFGAVEDSEIRDLTVSPGNVMTSRSIAGILAGSVEHSRIFQVSVTGTLRTSGTAGGIAGTVSGESVLENCTADHVAIDAGKGQENHAGGIAGTASASLIADCTVNTGDSLSARIQGGGLIGGITGFQNGTDIFNTHVMGTIGGSGSRAIGGITGKYASGKLKTARFEGTIASSGLGSASREGTFIGTRDSGFHFRYGTESGADLAYLFADSEAGILAGVCGSGIPEDNEYTEEAHIGFWHKGDNFFTLVHRGGSRPQEKQYFYEELENGVLHTIDMEDEARNGRYRPDHFAPGPAGRPQRGYLVSVLQVDTAAGGQYYYDVASLTARGSSAYSRDLNKTVRGAVAAGDTVTVVTAPRNTEEEKYQMAGSPMYTDADGSRREMSCTAGGAYTFVMPECDTEISVEYRKVAAGVRTVPEEYVFRVVQERSGNRKDPSIITEVRDGAGKLTARYINGQLDHAAEVQEVRISAIVDKNNDVADSRVVWSIDDHELLRLKKNGDEDAEGYTEKSASLELNLNAGFFREIISHAEQEQAESGYLHSIPDTIYGEGNGGVAVLTASTRPAASFEGKPLKANCRITVTFQILDRTRVAAEGVSLDQDSLWFQVCRILTGDRKNPDETVTVSPPQALSAGVEPDHFDKKEVLWSVSDPQILKLDKDSTGGDHRHVSVSAEGGAKWIRDIMAADDGLHENDPYARRSGSGIRKGNVTVTVRDRLGNSKTASCEVTVEFITEDRTVAVPEEIRMDPAPAVIRIVEKKSGDSRSKTVEWTGTEEELPWTEIIPDLKQSDVYEPFDRTLVWSSSDPALKTENGKIKADTRADWIREAGKTPPYHGEKEVILSVRGAGENGAESQCRVKMIYDMNCLEIQDDLPVFDLVLTKTGKRSAPVLTWSGTEERKLDAAVYPGLSDNGNIVWTSESDVLAVEPDGTVRPVPEAEAIRKAVEDYPHTAVIKGAVTASCGGMHDTAEILLKIRVDDRTYSSGSGGSSGGNTSSGSSASRGVTTGGSVSRTVSGSSGSVTGTWIQDGEGNWLFTGNGRTYADEWAYIHNPYASGEQSSTDWFRFGPDGRMVTGWYRDPDKGDWYCLHGISDGTRGRMYTGWQRIDGFWYYFNPVPDGSRGKMMTGWQQIDGKWYFLWPSDGHMAVSEETPDGFFVDETGAWTGSAGRETEKP